MMTVAEIAKRLRVSLACAYALIDAGELACYRIGLRRGVIRVSEEQLQAFLARSEVFADALSDAQTTSLPRQKDFSFLPPPS